MRLFKWMKTVPLESYFITAIWILSIFVIGLVDLVNFRLNIYRILTADYWADTLTLILTSILIFATTLVTDSKKHVKTEVHAQEVLTDLEESIRKYKTPDFLSYLKIVNLKRLREAFVELKSLEMRNLDSRASIKDIEIWELPAQRPFRNPENVEYQPIKENIRRKKRNPFCRKKKRLERVLSTEYLDANAAYLKAKYTPITMTFIMSGANQRIAKDNSTNPSRGLSMAVRDNWMRFVVPTLFVAFLISTYITRTEEDNIIVALIIGFKVLLLIIQSYNAKIYAPRWVKLTWVADVHLRNTIWMEYLLWKGNKKEAIPHG